MKKLFGRKKAAEPAPVAETKGPIVKALSSPTPILPEARKGRRMTARTDTILSQTLGG